jgi:hypothetical protein
MLAVGGFVAQVGSIVAPPQVGRGWLADPPVTSVQDQQASAVPTVQTFGFEWA